MPREAVDLTGKTFGSWTVLQRTDPPRHKTSHAYWLCRCSCPSGTVKPVSGAALRRGASTRCRECSSRARWKGQTP